MFFLYAVFHMKRIVDLVKRNDSPQIIVAALGTPEKSGRPNMISPQGQRFIRRMAGIPLFFFPSVRKRSCLVLSCLILDWSRRRGLDPLLNIGILESQKEAEGHAWLSYEGTPFCEPSSWHLRCPHFLVGQNGVAYWYGQSADPRGKVVKTYPSP